MKLAQVNFTGPGVFQNISPSNLVGVVLSRFLLFAIPVAGIYFLVRLILSGYNFMTSLGDPAKIQAAQQQLVNAGFGLLIVISAYFITQIIQSILGVTIL